MTDFNDAIAAGDGTLHGAIDYWQERTKRAEAERDAARARTLTLTPKEVEALFWFSGAGTDDGSEITLGWLDQHEGGAGWYAWLSEYPEEGSVAVKLPCDDHNVDADDALREGEK